MDYEQFKQAVKNSDLPQYGKFYNFSEYYQYVSSFHEVTYDLDCSTWFYTTNRSNQDNTLLIGTGKTLLEAIKTYRSYGNLAA